MTAFLYKFSTTQTQQNGAINRMMAEIRQGFNGLYADFGGDLGDSIQALLFARPISVGMDVGAYSASTRPDDTGTMQFTYVWGEFGPVPDPNSPDPEHPIMIQISTPGFWCDLICDLGGTTVDPIWVQETIQERWSRGNKTTRQTTPEQQAVNGGKSEVEFVSTGNSQVWLCSPEVYYIMGEEGPTVDPDRPSAAKHGFAGVLNQPLSGTPEPDATSTGHGRR